jgi:hypothetical protein
MRNSRCRKHGGATPRGVAHPNFKHGRHSVDLPTRLAADYEAGRADKKLLELIDDIAVTDARFLDLLRRVDSGEAGILWRTLKGLKAKADAAKMAHDVERFAFYDSAITDIINRGVSDYAAWDEAGRWMDRKVRLVESQRKRAVELRQTITVQEMLTMIGVVSDILQRHIPDRDILKAIQHELNGLAGQELDETIN